MDAKPFSDLEAIIKNDIAKINNDLECYMKETEEFFETVEFKEILESPHGAECMAKILDLLQDLDDNSKLSVFMVITAALKKKYIENLSP